MNITTKKQLLKDLKKLQDNNFSGNATDVPYTDNKGLNATNIQEAVDNLKDYTDNKIADIIDDNSSSVDKTYSSDKIDKLIAGAGGGSNPSATDTTYVDNSNLNAKNVQEAIDNLKNYTDDEIGKITVPVNTSELVNDSNFATIDDDSSSTNTTYSSDKIDQLVANAGTGGGSNFSGNATDISYADNKGLGVTDVQGAIDKLKDNMDNITTTEIDDSQAVTNKTWSSQKIDSELQGKANNNHSHSARDIDYDDTNTSIGAKNVQEAIEMLSNLNSSRIEITLATDDLSKTDFTGITITATPVAGGDSKKAIVLSGDKAIIGGVDPLTQYRISVDDIDDYYTPQTVIIQTADVGESVSQTLTYKTQLKDVTINFILNENIQDIIANAKLRVSDLTDSTQNDLAITNNNSMVIKLNETKNYNLSAVGADENNDGINSNTVSISSGGLAGNYTINIYSNYANITLNFELNDGVTDLTANATLKVENVTDVDTQNIPITSNSSMIYRVEKLKEYNFTVEGQDQKSEDILSTTVNANDNGVTKSFNIKINSAYQEVTLNITKSNKVGDILNTTNIQINGSQTILVDNLSKIIKLDKRISPTTITITGLDNTGQDIQGKVELTLKSDGYFDNVVSLEVVCYVIYGVSVDESNSNPESCVTYIEEAVGVNVATPTGYGGWGDKFPFNQIKPCGFRNGAVTEYINPNDFTKYIDGTTVSTDDDVMIEFPKIYWKFTTTSNGYELRISNGKVDDDYICPAHTIGAKEVDKIYIGAYLGSEDSNGKVRSLNNQKPITNHSIGWFRTQTQANGTGYQQFNYYSLLMCQILYLIAYKNLDSQTALGYGYAGNNSSIINTGNTHNKGMVYGETSGTQQMKFLGIEDLWGNTWQFIDGFFCDLNNNLLISTNDIFNNDGNSYKNCNSFKGSVSGYLSKIQGTSETGFCLKEGNGSKTTYYCDYSDMIAGSVPLYGGKYNTFGNAGIFRLSVNTNPNTHFDNDTSGRLVYIGTEGGN